MRYRELPNTQRFEAWLFSLSINIQCERFASLDVVSILSLSLSSVVSTAAPHLSTRIRFRCRASLFLSHSLTPSLSFSLFLSLSLTYSNNTFSLETFAEKTRIAFAEILLVHPD